MPSSPSLCSYKRACKYDLGISLQSYGRTFWHGEKYGRSTEIFLFDKNSTGHQQVYHILHCLCHCQDNHTPLFLLLRGLGNPSRWITCPTFHPPRKTMITYLWWLIDFRRWPFSQPARRASQRQILPSSSLNKCGSILGYHKPSSPIETTGSSTHFGRVFGHCWTPSSLNPLPSTLKPMVKHRIK